MEMQPLSGPQSSGKEPEWFFDLSPDLCCVAGFDGYYKRVNAAFERTLGYSTRELQSRPLLDFVHPDDVESVRGVLDVLAAGQDATGHVNRLICADGSVRWIEWNTRGAPERGVAFGVGRDVTERRLAEVELREAKRIAEASRDELRPLADEQAALRRVATLVARQASQSEVFAAIAEECAQLFGTADIGVVRYEGACDHVVLASSGAFAGVLPAGSRGPLGDEIPPSRLFPEGRTVRMQIDTLPSGVIGRATRAGGITSVVATPILVDGRLWGSLGIGTTRDEAFPPETESRLGNFTELMAATIANTESRAEVERLATEQAALRRVATLVACESPPDEVFTTVAEEVALLLAPDAAVIARYEPDGHVSVMGGWGGPRITTLVGRRLELDSGAVALVYRTGRPARFDHYETAPGQTAARARHIGVRSAIATPIVVGGRLWGCIGAAFRTQTLPAGIESRLAEFAELVATAISNVQARSDLAASRARIAAAADEERRRVVRDLHDGAQQRLVHTIVTLKLARRALERGGEDMAALLSEAQQHAETATKELRELAHGILPSVLSGGGLRAAVAELASRMSIPVDIDIPVAGLPPAVEANTYFVVAEALTNVAKHSRARHVEVAAHTEDHTLRVHIRDDGVGGARPDGTGLLGIRDRLAALDGRLHIESPPDRGTLIVAEIPLPSTS
jgi:PAS domain S-box-containing protein